MYSSPENRLVDQRLRAENCCKGEAFGVFGLGLGGEDHDPQVIGGRDQGVAVKRDVAYFGVVDGFVPAVVLVRFEVAALPEFDEAWALRGEFAD